MVDANLLVTYDPSHRGGAKQEVETVLKEVGADPEFLESNVAGLFQLNVKEPKVIVKKLIALCKSDKDKFNLTYHYIPVDEWVETDVQKMQEVTKKLGERIKQEEKWKMNLNKRSYEGDTKDLIIKLTDPIDKPKVDLKNPDKIVQVEIIGNKTGISLLEKDELLEVPKLKV
ncbi:hypothetical protein B6U80_01245 [Candidatus Pacearchaeota archaeon ex4484_26]|nr:MAG: hypothetical protein B6U80_01245 [Candidatus Pacearchaeota archaeon ex4484_26]